jgi:hypothetical protein
MYKKKLKKKQETKVLVVKKPYFSMGEIPFKNSDLQRIRRLLFIGIIIRLKKKSDIKWKAWVWGFPHIWTVSRTPISAYRRMFKILKERGIYLP